MLEKEERNTRISNNARTTLRLQNDLKDGIKLLAKHNHISMNEQIKQNPNIAPPVCSTVTGLISILGKLLSSSYQKRREKLDAQIDSKLKSKIQEKKAAHGIRTDNTVSESSEESYEISM